MATGKEQRNYHLTNRLLTVCSVAVVLILSACNGGMAPLDTTTTPPEEVISIAVPGFNFIDKSDRVEPIFEGEEYSAESFFTPKANSKFHNKVDHLIVAVYLFKDDASSKEMANLLLIGVYATDIQVNGRKATITYNSTYGEAVVFLQKGRLVVYSFSASPFDASSGSPFDATTFDEVTLKDAAIEGFKAIRF